jgi:hypothetical protein
MWQKLVSFFQTEVKPILIPITNRNVVIITMFPKKRVITVSYKGETKQALMDDNSMHNMVHDHDYDKNSLKVFQTAAMLLLPLTKK